jgi:hypothetical protein
MAQLMTQPRTLEHATETHPAAQEIHSSPILDLKGALARFELTAIFQTDHSRLSYLFMISPIAALHNVADDFPRSTCSPRATATNS